MQAASRKLMFVGLALTAIVFVACGQSDEPGAADSPTGRREPTQTPQPTEVPPHGLLETAPDFTLPNANGPEVTLSDLSAEQPVVLVFYRAFW